MCWRVKAKVKALQGAWFCKFSVSHLTTYYQFAISSENQIVIKQWINFLGEPM